MGLVKRTYVDQVTVITAQNLNDIQDAIIANENDKANLTVIAGVESTSTASKAYSVGEYLVLNGILYKVTVAIAEEDTITDTGAGANVTSKTVGEELADIGGKAESAETIIGTTALPTTAQTLTGAIDEIYDITGDGTLTDFTTTDLTGAANELKVQANNLDEDKTNLTVIAGVETSTTASQAYTAGEYLVMSGVLYEVTADISSGGTITVGTNVQAATVCGALTQLKTSLNNLLIAEFDSTDGSIVFRDSEVASYDSTDGSIIINV